MAALRKSRLGGFGFTTTTRISAITYEAGL
jgi:hypothetical protein